MVSNEERSAAKKRHVTSMRGLERKVDRLAEEVVLDRAATTKLASKVDQQTERIDTLNLNGSAVALKQLAANTAQLLKLAEVAPRLVEAAEHKADVAAFWRVVRRYLNPLKPVGGVFWTVAGTIIAAVVWNAVIK